jgi:hypothetical protein
MTPTKKIANETPKERMARQKREAADARAKEVATAAKSAQQNYEAAKNISEAGKQSHFGPSARKQSY